MGKLRYKSYARQEWINQYKTQEGFEEAWTNAIKLSRRAYGDETGFSLSRQAWIFLANKERLYDKLGNPITTVLEEFQQGGLVGTTRKERRRLEILDRLMKFRESYDDEVAYIQNGKKVLFVELFDQFKKGEISYQRLKELIKNFEETNERYKQAGS